MAADKSLFQNYYKTKGHVRVANDAIIDIIGTGEVLIHTVVHGKAIKTTLKGVLHVPNIAANLLSQDQLVYESKLAIQHDSENGLRILDRSGTIVGTTSRKNRQQVLDTIYTAYISSHEKRPRINNLE